MSVPIRTYWLSFADPDTGKNRGVLVVDVTLSQARTALRRMPTMHDKKDGPWIAAAVQNAWQAGVNPGGEVAAYRVDTFPEAAKYPRLQLMTKDDVEALEL